MNIIIIKEVACPLCGAAKGQECTRADFGCGMRVDYFIGHGSYNSRLAVHLDSIKYLEEKFKDSPDFLEELRTESLFLTSEELEALGKNND